MRLRPKGAQFRAGHRGAQVGCQDRRGAHGEHPGLGSRRMFQVRAVSDCEDRRIRCRLQRCSYRHEAIRQVKPGFL